MPVTEWLSIGSTSSFSVATTNDIALDNPGNAFSDDNTYASADIAAFGGKTHEYNYFGFDFSSIPSDSSIEGIELRYMAYGESTIVTAYVSIYNNATATASAVRSRALTSSESTRTEGGATDMWGLTFTQAQLANDDLYARIYFRNPGSVGARFAYLDQIQVRVYYTEPNIAYVSRLSLTVTTYATTFFTNNVIVYAGIQSLTIATKTHPVNPTPDLQLVYPVADIATGGWTLTTGTDFFAVLDDTNTTDYAICNGAAEGTDLIVKLDALMPPVYSAGLEICAYVYATYIYTRLTISLLEGTTTLTSSSFDSDGDNGGNPVFLNTWGLMRLRCSTSVVDSIRSWGDLRLRFNDSNIGGSDQTRVAYAYVKALPPIGTIAFPVSTIGSNSASISGASTIHQALSLSESSYVTLDNTNEYFEVLLDTVTDPNSGLNHVLSFSVGSLDSSMGNGETFSVALLQGTTIKSTSDFYWENTGPFYYNIELTQAEADSITDYSDLRIKATITNGSSDSLRFYNVFLLVPEVSSTDVNASANLVSLTHAVYSVTVNTVASSSTTVGLVSLTTGIYSATAGVITNVVVNLASLTTAIYGVTVDAGQAVTVNLLSLTTAAYSVTVSSGLTTSTNLVSLTTGTLSPTINLDYVNAVALQSLTTQVIGAAAQPYASSNVDLHDGLVSYWGLNELSGTRYDSVGANNLTVSGGTPGNSTDTVASSTRSLQLDSQDYYADTDLLGNFSLDEFSFSLWAKPVNVTTKASTYRGTAFLLRTSSSAPIIAIRLSGDTDDWEVYNWDNATVAATGSGSATTSWQMLSVTYSAANGLRFYVNGTLADTGGTYSYPTADQVFLGYTTTTFGYDGLLDEVGLWERELTQDEIDQLYNSGNGQTYPFNQFIHYQVANPAQDITTGQWTLSAGTNFYETLTDGTSGYAQIQGTAVSKTLELKLEPISEPLVDEGLIIEVYAQGGNSGANQRLIVQLYQGTTQIASKEFNSSERVSSRENWWDVFANDLYFSIPKASAANITDYTDLRVRFNVVNQASSETLEIYYVKLYAAPSGGQIVSTNATTDIPSGWSVTNAATAHAALADGENSTYVRSRDDVDPLLVRFAPLVDPGINVGLTILVGFKGAVANDFGQADGLSCSLYQGTAGIANVFSNYESQVTGWVDHYIFQFDSLAITDITDFSNLNVRFSMGIKDSTEGYDIEYAYLFAPDPVYIATPALASLTPATYSVTVAVGTGSINAAGLTSLTIATYSVTVNTDAAITVGLTAFATASYSVTVSTGITIAAGLTSLATASYSVTVSADVVTAVGLNTLTVTSYSAETNTNVVTAAGLTALTITLHSTTINTSATIEVGLASLTIATYSRTVAIGLTTEANLNQLSTATYSVTVSTDAVTTVGITSLTEASYASTATGDATQSVDLTTLTVGTLSPTVTGDAIVSAGLQSLTVAAITPSVSDGTSISVSVGICSNSVTTLTPTVNYDYAVTTNPNGLTIGVLSTAVNTGVTVSVGNLQTLTITGYGIAISGSMTNIVQIVSLSIETLVATVSTQVSVSAGLQSLTLSTIAPTIFSGETTVANLVGLTIANYGVTVNYGCMTDAGLQTLTLAPFAATFGVGSVNVYDGNGFVKKIVKVFDGNNWVTRSLKHWDSSTWK